MTTSTTSNGRDAVGRRLAVVMLLGIVVHLPLRLRMALYYRSRPRGMLRWIGRNVVGVFTAGPPDHRYRMTLSVNQSWPYLLGVYGTRS